MDSQKQLQGQLNTLDTSLGFLLLLILSLLLSWQATALQRKGLADILSGDSTNLPDVSSLRLPASALVVGALTFFFGVSLDVLDSAQAGNRPSAQVNVWASLFVLAAALLRLYDQVCLQPRGTVSLDAALPE